MTTKRERDLGILEKYQLSKQFVRAYGNVAYTAELVHPERTKDPTLFYMNCLKTPLQNMIERHACLSLVVRDMDKSTVHFEQLLSVDLSKSVTVLSEQVKLEKLIQDSCTIEFDFDAPLPLWRITIVPRTPIHCTISLAFQHVIGDGSTLNTFWKELVKELQTVDHDCTHADFVVNVPENLKVPLPYEKSGCPEISIFTDVIPVAVTSKLAKWAPALTHTFSRTNWAGEFPAIDGEPHATQVIVHTLDSARWKPVLVEAKKRQLTGHAILYALYIMTWAILYGDSDVTIDTPLNCRSMCNPPIPPEQMGNYVGTYTVSWKQEYTSAILKKKAIWELAQTYSRGLKEGKLKGSKQALLLEYLPDFPSSFIQFWKSKRENDMKRSGGLELSDMGKWDTSDEAWKVNAIYFCQSTQTFTQVLGMNSVCLNGDLHYTLCYQKGALSKEKIQSFNKHFDELVQQLTV